MCVRLSVKSNLTSGASVRPENTVMYSAGNGGQKLCGVFSETALFQRSSTAPLKVIRTFGNFLCKAHYMKARPVTFGRSAQRCWSSVLIL